MSNIKQVAVLGKDGNYGTPSDIGVDLVNVDITKAIATAVNSATGMTPANAEDAIEAMAGTLKNKAEASHNQDASSITSGTLSSDRLPTVPVSKGGTGATTLASGQALIGNGTGAVTGRAITAIPAVNSTSLFTAGGAHTELVKKAPTSHASTTTTYGASSGSNYGHTKLSDNYTSSAGAAASGIGASSAAVYNCYNELNSNIEEVRTNFQDGCSTIAAAITEMGVTTSYNASPDTMANNIKQLPNEVLMIPFKGVARTSATVIKLDISSHYANYQDITINNLIVQINGNAVTSASTGVNTYTYTYDNTTGIITITATKGLWSSTSANNNLDVYIVDKKINIYNNTPESSEHGLKLTNYKINLSCGESHKYQDDSAGISRGSSSSLEIDVSNYNTLYIGSYTTTTNSSHPNGKPTATLTCSVDGTSTTLNKTSGTTINVSNATTVKLTGKFTSNAGPSYSVSGSITVSEIKVLE